MIEPVILNKNFEALAVIDDYSSLIWTTRYYKCGDFEIVVPVTEKYVELMQIGYYLRRDDDENVGIIEDFEISRSEEGDEQMIVTGRFLASILSRRIIAQQTTVNTSVSSAILTLLNQNVRSASIGNRHITNIDWKTVSVGSLTKIQAQYTGKNLLETIENICETYQYGFKITLSDENHFVCELYQGTDRSYAQTTNPYVIFSDEYDNLLSSRYQKQSSELVTDVLVAGEGEGLDRKTLWVSKDNPSGLDRYEMYLDQRNMSTNDGEITETEYQNQMKEEGMENITQITTAFEGTVYFDNVKYKEDVNIGDVCVIENKKWGISINSRLIEVIESVDESGVYQVVPTFGV